MILSVKVTNISGKDRTYLWSNAGKFFVHMDKSEVLDFSILPTLSDVTRRKCLEADIKSKNVALTLITDLPVESAGRHSDLGYAKPKVEEMMKKEIEVEALEVLSTREEAKLNDMRFVKGKVEEFRSEAKSIDNNESKPMEPITVDMFKDKGFAAQLPPAVELFKDSADAAYRKTSENVFAPVSIEEKLESNESNMTKDAPVTMQEVVDNKVVESGPMEVMFEQKRRGRKKAVKE
jgi:hypothetical protein